MTFNYGYLRHNWPAARDSIIQYMLPQCIYIQNNVRNCFLEDKPACHIWKSLHFGRFKSTICAGANHAVVSATNNISPPIR